MRAGVRAGVRTGGRVGEQAVVRAGLREGVRADMQADVRLDNCSLCWDIIILPKASAGDNLIVDYVGRLHGETGKVFDDTKKKGFPFKFQLGGGRIIEGLERGVRGMCKGETRSLIVPPELG